MSTMPCETCRGTRLRPHSLAVRIGGFNIHEVSSMTVEKLIPFFEGLTFQGFKKEIDR